MLTDSRRLAAMKANKMTPKLILLIEEKLEEKWSPEQISGWLGNEIHTTVTHETIYQHIWYEKCLGGNLHNHLRRKGKAYQSRAESQAGRGHIKNRISIDERPNIVDEKARVGDWEIDLVIGKGHSGALVTIVERQTSFTVSTRIFDKQVTKSLMATRVK